MSSTLTPTAMYEELNEIFLDKQSAMNRAQQINEGHPGDCCQVKWVAEPEGKTWKVFRYIKEGK